MVEQHISWAVLEKICPFYFVLDDAGLFTHLGKGFAKCYPGIAPGVIFSDCFNIKDSSDSILHSANRNSLCVITSKYNKLTMKCNPLNIGDGLFLYVGYPILTGGVSLRDYGLTISDLPQHDAVMEFLFIMEGMKRSLFESEQYLNQVTEMNNRLDYLVKVRTQQLEVAHEELEAFVRTISHDLRSPLRLINSFATLVLEDSVSIKPDKIEMLQLIKKSSDNMGNIISDLLSLAKVNHSTPRKSHVDVKQLVLDILREVKHTGIYETSFTNIVVADLAGLQGDKGLIRLVFQNLINNAIKYSSKTAHPAIEIGMLQTEQSEMVYYVKDNGVGFNSEEASQLFKPFQRMHSQSEFDGTGIGLSIVKAIMNKHNGRVWAQSSENMGATFYLAFPPND